ncbi:hypothetical protein SRHO_G00007460 [Serrasalmus rhombeus]
MLGLHPSTKTISRHVCKVHFDEMCFSSFMEVKLHYLPERHLHLKPDSVPASAEHQHSEPIHLLISFKSIYFHSNFSQSMSTATKRTADVNKRADVF